MRTFMHTVRFVLGMAMLSGGVLLSQPFVAAVLAARAGQGTMPTEGVDVPFAATAAGGQPAGPVVMSAAAGHAIPDGRQAMGLEGPGVTPAPAIHGAVVAAPQPPSPLPVSSIDLSPASPTLDGTYRSTVDIPPPPLLDIHAPPPLSAGWSTHDVARTATPSPAAQVANPTAEYLVRDGDDLTGIALRVYGHAGAANAIWTANKDRLADPQVLPIGMSLRLPPSWTIAAAHSGHASGAAQAIEPTYTAAAGGDSRRDGGANASDRPTIRGGDESFWLQAAPSNESAPRVIAAQSAAHGTPQQGSAAVAAGASRPATIRVGLGDSLESIAVRFYGDRSMASRIWMANRDRLRSPDLLVPGAELRLP